jgi:hypothetical protein
LRSNTCSSNISGMDDDVDFSGWELPPLEDDPDREPPPERESWGVDRVGPGGSAVRRWRRAGSRDGLQQQLLAEVALGDTGKDRWVKEEVAAALGLAPVTAGTKLRNAEQLCTRLPSTLGLLLDGRISGLQARVVTEAFCLLPDAPASAGSCSR